MTGLYYSNVRTTATIMTLGGTGPTRASKDEPESDMPTRKKPATTAWPLGEYLRDQRGRMAIREAARRADISESRWRQVEAGVQKMAGGIEVPVHPRAETLAAMARAISADGRTALELAGHNPDQYAWLLEPSADLGNDETREWFTGLPREEREQVLAELQRLHLETELRKQDGRRAPRNATG